LFWAAVMSLVCWIGVAVIVMDVATRLLNGCDKLILAAEKLYSTLRDLLRKIKSKLKSR
jgi:hypothetical protein